MRFSLVPEFNLFGEKDYHLALAQGPFEKRFYPRMHAVTVRSDDAHEGWEKLKEYVSGKNFHLEELAHRELYYFEPDFSVAGLLITEWRDDMEMPEPIDRSLKLEVIPSMDVAILRFHGSLSAGLIERKALQLGKWIDYRGFERLPRRRILKNESDPLTWLFRSFEYHWEIKEESYE